MYPSYWIEVQTVANRQFRNCLRKTLTYIKGIWVTNFSISFLNANPTRIEHCFPKDTSLIKENVQVRRRNKFLPQNLSFINLKTTQNDEMT